VDLPGVLRFVAGVLSDPVPGVHPGVKRPRDLSVSGVCWEYKDSGVYSGVEPWIPERLLASCWGAPRRGPPGLYMRGASFSDDQRVRLFILYSAVLASLCT